jgi:hypothetical protein
LPRIAALNDSQKPSPRVLTAAGSLKLLDKRRYAIDNLLGLRPAYRPVTVDDFIADL